MFDHDSKSKDNLTPLPLDSPVPGSLSADEAERAAEQSDLFGPVEPMPSFGLFCDANRSRRQPPCLLSPPSHLLQPNPESAPKPASTSLAPKKIKQSGQFKSVFDHPFFSPPLFKQSKFVEELRNPKPFPKLPGWKSAMETYHETDTAPEPQSTEEIVADEKAIGPVFGQEDYQLAAGKDPKKLQRIRRQVSQLGRFIGRNTIGKKILHRFLFNTTIGVGSIGTLTRASKFFIDSYAIIDEQREIKAKFQPNITKYYKDLGRELFVNGKLSKKWKDFKKDKNNVLPGEWIFGLSSFLSTGWWLNGAHQVDADISFMARIDDNKIQLRNIKAQWVWHDAIDANSPEEWFNEKKTWEARLKIKNLANLYLESLLWDLYMDKILDTDFKVKIFWSDQVRSINVPITAELKK